LAAGVLALGAAGLLSLGRMVQWEGILVVERDHRAAKVGSAVGSAASIGWVGHLLDWEWVREAMGEVLVGLGWLIVK
jgi:hypothetical protein